MNSDELVALLGRPVTDRELIDYFKKNGIDLAKEVQLEPGDYSTYIVRKKDGYSLTFTDEGMFLNKPDQPFGEGPLYFSDAFFYSQGKNGYSQYRGSLPRNIKFSDTREDIIKKLGNPSWQRKLRNGVIAAERWDNLDASGKRIHITYYKDKPVPAIIAIGIPDK